MLDGNEALYVQECLRTNSISSVGRFVADFERKFAEFCSVRHAISTCNGTCALHLALIALGLKPGPRFGEILEAVETRQLEGTLRDREEALAWVKARWMQQS